MSDTPELAQYHTFIKSYKDKRNTYWGRLMKANREFTSKSSDISTFTKWMIEMYGIEPQFNEQGYFTADFNIIDEKKYTLFLIKFE